MLDAITAELKDKLGMKVSPEGAALIIEHIRSNFKSLLSEIRQREQLLTETAAYDFLQPMVRKSWLKRGPTTELASYLGGWAKEEKLEVEFRVLNRINSVYASLAADTLFAAAVISKSKKGAEVSKHDLTEVCERVFEKPWILCSGP